jgi:hypothetical protein
LTNSIEFVAVPVRLLGRPFEVGRQSVAIDVSAQAMLSRQFSAVFNRHEKAEAVLTTSARSFC